MPIKIRYIILFLFFSISVFGQVINIPCPGGEDPPCDEQAPELPIDGGIIYLLLAGAVYGYFKLIKNE